MKEYVKLIKKTIDCTPDKIYEVVNKRVSVTIIDDVGDKNELSADWVEFVDKPDDSTPKTNKIANPFIKTSPTIVNGSYTFPSYAVIDITDVGTASVLISTDYYYDKESLKQLIQILTEIEEVME